MALSIHFQYEVEDPILKQNVDWNKYDFYCILQLSKSKPKMLCIKGTQEKIPMNIFSQKTSCSLCSPRCTFDRGNQNESNGLGAGTSGPIEQLWPGRNNKQPIHILCVYLMNLNPIVREIVDFYSNPSCMLNCFIMDDGAVQSSDCRCIRCCALVEIQQLQR